MIYQGHRYSIDGHSVLAMESASRGVVAVCRILKDDVRTLGPRIFVACDKLTPEPMRYHGCNIPN